MISVFLCSLNLIFHFENPLDDVDVSVVFLDMGFQIQSQSWMHVLKIEKLIRELLIFNFYQGKGP